MSLPYDYQDKGRADFAAGKRDDVLYNVTAAHGEAYRRGWQLARLGHIADQPKPEPRPEAFVSAPLSDAPPWENEPATVRETAPAQPAAAVLAPSNEVEKVNIGEKSPNLPNCPISQTDRACLTREDVRLSAGEDKPKKSKPAPAGQLDLFG